MYVHDNGRIVSVDGVRSLAGVEDPEISLREGFGNKNVKFEHSLYSDQFPHICHNVYRVAGTRAEIHFRTTKPVTCTHAFSLNGRRYELEYAGTLHVSDFEGRMVKLSGGVVYVGFGANSLYLPIDFGE